MPSAFASSQICTALIGRIAVVIEETLSQTFLVEAKSQGRPLPCPHTPMPHASCRRASISCQSNVSDLGHSYDSDSDGLFSVQVNQMTPVTTETAPKRCLWLSWGFASANLVGRFLHEDAGGFGQRGCIVLAGIGGTPAGDAACQRIKLFRGKLVAFLPGQCNQVFRGLASLRLLDLLGGQVFKIHSSISYHQNPLKSIRHQTPCPLPIVVVFSISFKYLCIDDLGLR